jgi:hypothetical protein
MSPAAESLPEPVEIAAGSWQLLPAAEADLGEIAAIDGPEQVRAALTDAVRAGLAGTATTWTIRTAVGGWIEGIVTVVAPEAEPSSGTTLSLRTVMLDSAASEAARTARAAVGRYVAAISPGRDGLTSD